ncbi:glucose-1-phosphate thymidylyltransferase RfbA [Alkalibacter rhizosphaerae]|uniref:Glucose-1-phosphate thymidylyltransferase n=1 Tax=Alkalibacter rhizosphaerae TaxID=2815577 RepID=A0A974XNU4_9FIRM|nr:glucose-1-phosphate thymidylyltransferase RfbA [Alkalibacter rhizosphaerae]QSX09286.1 glucose-1-phosphate thymidylyltransferase RfbA [Alkalibacter rhizosphaerae]
MKGIILAGGTGSRLFPITKTVNKHLLPIYDKPMIYYPLSVLMLAGIRNILLITNPEDVDSFRRLFEDGSRLGISLKYMIQENPRGIADAILIGEEFIQNESVCVILGDNVFYGLDLTKILLQAQENKSGATVFGYPVKDARDFGVLEFGEDAQVLSIEEKPTKPRSNFAIPGLYFYDNKAVKIAKKLKPSARKELEITDLNREYLQRGELHGIQMGRGMAWLDTGTPHGLIKAAEFVEVIQSRQGFYIACIEEIAWRRGFIDENQLYELGKEMNMTEYGKYILSLLEGYSSK